MADPTTPTKTPTAENQGPPQAPAGTKAAERARTEPRTQEEHDEAAASRLAMAARSANAQALANEAAAKRRKEAPQPDLANYSGVVSAKDNQPWATPVDTSGADPKAKPEDGGPHVQTPHDAGVLTTHDTDKMGDLPFVAGGLPAVPTQDPPINVGARVPVGHARVDLTKRGIAPDAGGEGLQGQPGGHIGSGDANVPPTPVWRNPRTTRDRRVVE